MNDNIIELSYKNVFHISINSSEGCHLSIDTTNCLYLSLFLVKEIRLTFD